MKKSVIVLFGILTLTFFALPIQAQDGFTELRQPVAEVLNLEVNGTIPVLVNLTSNFQWVTRLVWALDFVSNQIMFTEFAGGPALTVGLQVLHDGSSILGNGEITKNHEFGHTSFDVKILSDEAGTKNRILLARWNIDAAVPPSGIRYISNESFQFLISDDLTDPALFITEFTVTVAGFRTESILEEDSNQADFFLIDVANWWGLFLYQNIFVLLVATASIIILIKIFRGN